VQRSLGRRHGVINVAVRGVRPIAEQLFRRRLDNRRNAASRPEPSVDKVLRFNIIHQESSAHRVLSHLAMASDG
jgi:hypothetical protein